jgi:myosin heavy subunit
MLAERVCERKIYTQIGSGILIAINPYKQLAVYGNDTKAQYANQSKEILEGTNPHLYKIAAKAYFAMSQTSSAQSLVITGESGAGKTESMKYI